MMSGDLVGGGLGFMLVRWDTDILRKIKLEIVCFV
jgi:hypothetical protein